MHQQTLHCQGRVCCPGKQHSRQRQRHSFLVLHRSRHLQCNAASFHPTLQQATAFAPATVANLGPGFDWLGCAVEGQGDTVTATVLPDQPGEVIIEHIEGDGGRLTLEAAKNCVGIAAIHTLRLLQELHGGAPSCGVSLRLNKGLPLGSGLGSSAASAAAGAVAVNGLFGSAVSREALVEAGLEAEATVSGYHADNIAPAILGGFILIRDCRRGEPLRMKRLEFNGDLWFVLVNPKFEAPTAAMRAVLPETVPMGSLTRNAAAGSCLVAGIFEGSAQQIGEALDSDCIVEPVRGPLIPGFTAVKAAAKAAGAFGCTISGAGPTCVAVVDSEVIGQSVAEAMTAAFQSEGQLGVNTAQVVRINNCGTVLRSTGHAL